MNYPHLPNPREYAMLVYEIMRDQQCSKEEAEKLARQITAEMIAEDFSRGTVYHLVTGEEPEESPTPNAPIFQAPEPWRYLTFLFGCAFAVSLALNLVFVYAFWQAGVLP